jgi:hypothetical protein
MLPFSQMITSILSSSQITTQYVKEKISPSQVITSILSSSQMRKPNVQAYAINQPEDTSML